MVQSNYFYEAALTMIVNAQPASWMDAAVTLQISYSNVVSGQEALRTYTRTVTGYSTQRSTLNSSTYATTITPISVTAPSSTAASGSSPSSDGGAAPGSGSSGPGSGSGSNAPSVGNGSSGSDSNRPGAGNGFPGVGNSDTGSSGGPSGSGVNGLWI